MNVRIGTRGSELAQWQARHVAERLGVETRIVIVETRGDRLTDVPLTEVDGRAFFTAEIEQALLAGEIDLAVHSLKDLTTMARPGLVVAAVLPRGPSDDVLVVAPAAYEASACWIPMRRGATVGTSAPRRTAQIAALRPDLQTVPLRGNVPTRVERVREGRVDAVVLARAGLERLALDVGELKVVPLPPRLVVPAPGQGALAVQARRRDADLISLCRERLHDGATAAIVDAERRLLMLAGGGCNLPLGALVCREGSAYRALGFLGFREPGSAAGWRWATARAASPAAAADALWARLRTDEPTFEGPLEGLRVVLIGVSRDGGLLAERLIALGARVCRLPVLAYEDVPVPDLPVRIGSLGPGDALAVTSQHAAERLAGFAVPDGVAVGAVGEATARALRLGGVRVDVTAGGCAADLADRLPVSCGARVLYPCAEEVRPDLAARLQARGAQVERIVLYRTIPAAHAGPAPAADLLRVYLSPTAVRVARALGWEGEGSSVTRIAIGPATARTLAAEGLPHCHDGGAGPEGVVRALALLAGASRKADG